MKINRFRKVTELQKYEYTSRVLGVFLIDEIDERP